MIRKAWFEEFRALRKVSVELEPLTVFVGPNGSGKTSVLEGIFYPLRLAWQPIPKVLAGHWRADRLRNTRATGPMRLGVSFEGQVASSLELVVTPSEDVEEEPPYGAVMRATLGAISTEWNSSETPKKSLVPEFGSVRHAAGRVVFLRLSAPSLAEPSYADTEQPELSPTGEGLASVLDDLAGSEPERKEAITEALRKVVPTVRRIRTERAAVLRRETELITIGSEQVPRHREVKYWGSRVVLDTTSGEGIPLTATSEGTVLALGLMTVLYGRKPPRTLLMDDLDRALHPRAQQDLVGTLRVAMAANPDLQILATTHSPFILNELGYPEVRLAMLSDDGATIVGALTDHPDYERWKALVKPGELWTSELEDWLRTARRAEA